MARKGDLAGAESQRRYRKTAKGKATMRRYSQSEKGKDKNYNFSKTEKAKVSRKAFKKTDKGKACAARYNKKYKQEINPQYWRNMLLREYGLTEEMYIAIEQKQNGLCAICKREYSGKLHVDHDHSKKIDDVDYVRGLLCPNCNRGLGMFKDDVEALETAIKYLKGIA